jgi:O-antigen/teichoic acid export membrane protein
VVGLAGGLAGFLLTMTAHEREAAWIIGGTAVLNITLAIILTPRYGAVGTASATLIAVLVRAVVLRRYISRTMSLRVPSL